MDAKFNIFIIFIHISEFGLVILNPVQQNTPFLTCFNPYLSLFKC